MIKVEYPVNECPNYEDLYLAVFSLNIAAMQTDWDNIRNANVELQQFPAQLRDILLAKYDVLSRIYISYMQVPSALRASLHDKLVEIFNYDAWGSDIAYYFMEPTHKFKFSTCHYCDTAYVNSYRVNTEKDAIFFLNTASDDELKARIQTRSQNSINAYKAVRPYRNRGDFDNVATALGCDPNKYDKVFSPSRVMKRHFDVEHVLPKTNCPLVGLSLYNFVPSCQVCNSKLKRTRVLGLYGIPLEKLSPTSNLHDFDSCVKFKLIPLPGCKLSGQPTQTSNSYNLELDSSLDPDYDYTINLFKLNERYSYHKMEALHWLELKYKYSGARLAMMANALHTPELSATKIKKDIFQTTLDKKHHRVFGKLKKDILN